MPQQSRPTLVLPFVASGAITQYRGVGFSGAQATVAGQKVVGFARRSAPAGHEVDVVAKGTAIAEAGAAFAAGQALQVNASGQVIAATAVAVAATGITVAAGGVAMTSTAANGAVLSGSGTVSGGDLPQYVCGIALEASAAAGNLVEIVLT